MSTFNERLDSALGGSYEPFMRRSIQTVILFETHRCLKDKLPSLRPFQKKLAVYEHANHLLSATSLTPRQQEEVMWRTGVSKEALNADLLWRRTRDVLQDVRKLATQMEAFAKTRDPKPEKEDEEAADGPKKEHVELYRAFLQKAYVDMTGKTEETFPPRFEFTHNNCLIVYKMYYNNGSQMDKTFPAPEKCNVMVPNRKPKGGVMAYLAERSAGAATAPASPGRNGQGNAGQRNAGPLMANRIFQAAVRAASPPGSPVTPGRLQQQKRLEQLREVREHMDLLKQFEGVVDEQALNKRKRELFESLPPAPPACFHRNHQQMAAAKAARSGPTGDEANQTRDSFEII